MCSGLVSSAIGKSVTASAAGELGSASATVQSGLSTSLGSVATSMILSTQFLSLTSGLSAYLLCIEVLVVSCRGSVSNCQSWALLKAVGASLHPLLLHQKMCLAIGPTLPPLLQACLSSLPSILHPSFWGRGSWLHNLLPLLHRHSRSR